MMTGSGPFGPIEMGGMFTVVKVRDGLARNDYGDPGPYRHPQGTVAYEIEMPPREAPRQTGPGNKPAGEPESKPMEMKGMKVMKGM
jgi:manganese oxidase